MEYMYVYEEYETSWWRRFTEEEYENENNARMARGYGWFRTFETSKDLGETVRLRPEEVAHAREVNLRLS